MVAAPVGRREFLRRSTRYGLAGLSLPALLAACGSDNPEVEAEVRGTRQERDAFGTPIVGDVLDFALTSDEWAGAFGFVTLRLHRGVCDGNDVFFIRTDTSDEGFAQEEGLVFAPKLGGLTGPGLAGTAYLFDDGTNDQAAVLSSEPGRPDYTPAWKVSRGTWNSTPRTLSSVAEVEDARRKGDLKVEGENIILNAAVVRWPKGELGVDSELTEYLGGGQLIEAPDTSAMEVTFKLHECFPASRYIVTEHSIAPAAEMTTTGFAPGLHAGPNKAQATGRTNVFMNGLEGPGPMGFQPSVFDSDPGSAKWSPYWDHFAYEWKQKASPSVLREEEDVHAARDAGELKEYPGTPDTKGELFTVNCPVPVTAPPTFSG
ncbi:MAG: DUF7482 domain-containing protein [Actinomycetota bacterium]